jgi:hypothetical protein
MPQYFIQLYGERWLLEEYVYAFPGNDDAYFVVKDDERLLTGSIFGPLEDLRDVLLLANTVLDQMHAALAIMHPGLERPHLGIPYRLDADGTVVWGDNYATGTVTIPGRIRELPADLSTIPTPTTAQRIRAAVRSNRHLDLAITIFFLPRTTWPHLYRCLEEVESFLAMKVSTAGMCSENDRERFTRTANTAEAAGLDARHGLGKFAPPRNPMTMNEATLFLRELCAQAIARAQSTGNAA